MTKVVIKSEKNNPFTMIFYGYFDIYVYLAMNSELDEAFP